MDEVSINAKPVSAMTPEELAHEVIRLRRIVWCAVRHARRIHGQMRFPHWSRVGGVCGLGSTSATQLCIEYGVDAHTGEEIPKVVAK